MKILMSPKFAKRLALALLLTTLVLTLVSFTAQLGLKTLSQFTGARSTLDMPASRELARSVVGMVNVDYEQNIPTWFSASVLLLNSVLLAAIASTKKALGDKYVAHWWALSVIPFVIHGRSGTYPRYGRLAPVARASDWWHLHILLGHPVVSVRVVSPVDLLEVLFCAPKAG